MTTDGHGIFEFAQTGLCNHNGLTRFLRDISFWNKSRSPRRNQSYCIGRIGRFRDLMIGINYGKETLKMLRSNKNPARILDAKSLISRRIESQKCFLHCGNPFFQPAASGIIDKILGNCQRSLRQAEFHLPALADFIE